MLGGLSVKERARQYYGALASGGASNINKRLLAKATRQLEITNDPFHQKIANVINASPGVVVDMGCGSGHLRKHLVGCRYIGIDIAPTSISADADWLIEANKTSTGLPAKKAKYVVFSRSLQCDGTPDQSLEEAARILKPGGVMILRDQAHRKHNLHKIDWMSHIKGFKLLDIEDSGLFKHIDHHNNTFFTCLFFHRKA